jgi:catalase (peroxidase I)
VFVVLAHTLLFLPTLLFSKQSLTYKEPIIHTFSLFFSSNKMKIQSSKTFYAVFALASSFALASKSDDYISAVQNLVKDTDFSFAVSNCPGSVGNTCAHWLRAVFHDAGTFSKVSKKGGTDGSLQFEADRSENAGLGSTIWFYKDIQAKHPKVSMADIMVIGAAMALRAAGGPKCRFQIGRVDATEANAEGLLPDTHHSLPKLVKQFDRMGLRKVDLLTLASGAHSLGGVSYKNFPSVEQSPQDVPLEEQTTQFDDTPGQFDTNIFKKILDNSAILPSDKIMNTDKDMREKMNDFIKEPKDFKNQFCESFHKMVNLGQSDKVFRQKVYIVKEDDGYGSFTYKLRVD